MDGGKERDADKGVNR